MALQSKKSNFSLKCYQLAPFAYCSKTHTWNNEYSYGGHRRFLSFVLGSVACGLLKYVQMSHVCNCVCSIAAFC